MKRLLLFLVCSALALAQAPPPKDRAGCQDSPVLTRLPGCWITRCVASDFGAVDLRVVKAGPANKHLEGATEEIYYSCPRTMSAVQIWREAENAFRQAGFTQVFEDNYGNARTTVTVQKGPQWAELYAENGNYRLRMVKVKAIEGVLKADADGWAQQMDQSGRVSIYGINFDTGKAVVRPDSEPVLQEVLKLLQKQPEMCVVVAGHTDNAGTDAVNVPLSQQRAAAVIAWLGSKGIDKMRLTPAGFGPRKPLADNATEEGRAKNRRVDLVKLY